MKNKSILIILILSSILVFGVLYYLNRKGKIQNFDSIENNKELSVLESVEVEFSDFDLKEEWDESEAIKIILNGNDVTSNSDNVKINGQVIIISKGGTYELSGTLENGQIIVEVDEKEKIQLIFNGVDIYCSNSAPINIKSCDKAVITLAKNTENKLVDGTSYVLEAEEDEPNATLFSDDDLTINGEGSLIIYGNYNNGITCKNDLKIVNGNIKISAVNHGIKGKDSVTVKNGNITIEASGEGVKTSNTEEEEKGYICIKDGSISISAVGDGIQSTRLLQIDGGNIDITKSDEGLEAEVITINNGKIQLISKDDGLNAADKTTLTDSSNIDNKNIGMKQGGGEIVANDRLSININGGEIYINAEGDGIDSNGSVNISGGVTYVEGPTNNGNGALDCNGEFKVVGGSLIAIGSIGMVETPDDSSSQYSVSINLSSVQSAGTSVEIKDTEGNSILSKIPTKQYQSIVFSSSDLKQGKTYSIYINESFHENFTISELITSVGNAMNKMNDMKDGNIKGGGMKPPEEQKFKM